MIGHDAVVLGAGGSLRLGQPKQLLTIGGETLVARMTRLVLATRPARTVVVMRQGHDAGTNPAADPAAVLKKGDSWSFIDVSVMARWGKTSHSFKHIRKP